MSKGLKRIEDVDESDEVLSRGRRAATNTLRAVQKLLRRNTEETIVVVLGDEKLESTPSHPYFVRGNGWTAAGDLKVGDEVLTGSGRGLTIVALEARHHDPPIPVYNFDVAVDHTFFVGRNQVLVHNGGPAAALESIYIWKYYLMASTSELNYLAIGAGEKVARNAALPQGKIAAGVRNAAGRKKAAGDRLYVAGWYRRYLLSRYREDFWRSSFARQLVGTLVPRTDWEVRSGPTGGTAVFCRPDGVCEHTRRDGSLRTTRVYDIRWQHPSDLGKRGVGQDRILHANE